MESNVPSLNSTNQIPSPDHKGVFTSAPSTLPANPFVGLRPFTSDEGLLFFGRREQTLELLQQLHRTRFLSVVGSSGCGKSSLIRAGLIPNLKAGFLVEHSDQWYIVTTKPGDAPLQNLAQALVENVSTAPDGAAVSSLVEAMKVTGVQGLREFLTPLLKDSGSNLLLLVDQFEELFSFGEYAEKETSEVDESSDKSRQLAEKIERERKRDEATDFVSIMLGLAGEGSLPIYVVMTMRSDFLGDCDAFYGLPEAMNRSQYLVPRLTRQQRQEAIASPIILYGQMITPRLLDRVLNDAGAESDQLPVMQHVMMRTWEKWRAAGDASIDLANYEAAGTTRNALSDDAEEALSGMSEDDLKVTERLFQALTDTDARGRRLRRPAHLSQIEAITGASSAKLLEIIERFHSGGRSFLTLAQDEADPLIDISHESLIRQWTRLREWVSVEARSKDLYLRLVGTAIRFYKDEPEDVLLSGPALQFALEWLDKRKPNEAWAERYHPGLDQALSFLAASAAQRDKEAEERKRLRDQQLERERWDLAQAELLAKQKQRVAEAEAAARKTELEQATALASQKEVAARWQRRAIYALAGVLLLAVATSVYAVRSGLRAQASEKSAKQNEALAKQNEATAEQQRNNAQTLARDLEDSLDNERKLKEAVNTSLDNERRLRADAVKLTDQAVKLKNQAVAASIRARQQASIADASAVREKKAREDETIAKDLAVQEKARSQAFEMETIKASSKALATQLATKAFREGLALSKINNPKAAAKKYEDAAEEYKRINDPDGEATAYFEIADICLKSEDSQMLQTGVEYLSKAENTYEQIPNPNGAAAVYMKFAEVLLSDIYLNDAGIDEANQAREDASSAYVDAYESYKKRDNLEGMSFVAEKLNDLVRHLKDLKDLTSLEHQQRELIDVYEGMLPLYRQKDQPRDEVSTYISIAKLHSELKETNKAKENFKNAVKVYGDKDPEAKARTYVDIGFALGGADDIKAYTEQALQTVGPAPTSLEVANTLSYIGSKFTELWLNKPPLAPEFASGLKAAADYYKQALAIYQNLNDRKKQAEVLSNLGTVSKPFDASLALDNFQRALALYTSAEEDPQRARLLFSIGLIQEQKGQLDEALKSYEAASKFYGDDSLEGMRAYRAILRVKKARNSKSG